MGEIVEFPGKRKNRTKKRLEDLFLERLSDDQQHCTMGDVAFTCATCGKSARFSFSGIIFRECSFYCGNCGVGYKLDNPLFGKRGSRTQR